MPAEKNSHYFRLGLTGWPLLGSSSPSLHEAALQAAGLNGEYGLYPIPVGETGLSNFEKLLERFHSGTLDGLNVTIPHKVTIANLVDRLTPTAQMVGAVNTVSLDDGFLVGDNTDAPGFAKDLETVTGWTVSCPAETPVKGRCLILGAGGAARAVVIVLARLGWNLTLAARREAQAHELVDLVVSAGATKPSVISLSALSMRKLCEQPYLVVNTTPVGMDPGINASPWPDDLPFPPEGFIYDLITRPRETLLVQKAKECGIGAAGGIGMLVEQAALAFEIWTGQPASRVAMRSAIGLTDR